MFKKQPKLALIAALLGGLIASPSWAACTQADGGGSWNVYITLPSNVWMACQFTAGTTGVIATGTRCTYSTGAVRTVMAGSSVRVGANCQASAKVVLSGGVVTTFNNMTFSRDKLQFSGVGSDNFGLKFTYNGIKL